MLGRPKLQTSLDDDEHKKNISKSMWNGKGWLWIQTLVTKGDMRLRRDNV